MPNELRVRLQAQGFDDEDLFRVVILERQDRPAERASDKKAARRRGADLLHALDAVLSARRIPYLSAAMGPRAALLTVVPDAEPRDRSGPAGRPARGDDANGSREVVPGCSSAFTGVAGAKRALQQAAAALHGGTPGAGAGKGGCVQGAERPSPPARRAEPAPCGASSSARSGRSSSGTSPPRSTLRDPPRPLEHGLAVQETADALRIHRNTLQKRLGHVEHLLSIDLSDLDAIVDIRLGLHAAELLDEPLA